jgi:hypothetical protein
MNFVFSNIHNNPFYKQKKQELRQSCNYHINNRKMKQKKLEFEIINSINSSKIKNLKYKRIDYKSKHYTPDIDHKKSRSEQVVSKKSNQLKFNPRKIHKSAADFNHINNLDSNDRLIYQTIVAKPKYKQLIKHKTSNNRIFTQCLLDKIDKKYQKLIEIKNEYSSNFEFIDQINKENKSMFYHFILYNRFTDC